MRAKETARSENARNLSRLFNDSEYICVFTENTQETIHINRIFIRNYREANGAKQNRRGGKPARMRYRLLDVFIWRGGGAAGLNPFAWPVASARPRNWARPSDSRRRAPIFPGTARASCCTACANAA